MNAIIGNENQSKCSSISSKDKPVEISTSFHFSHTSTLC